jgi:hypothetical protein
VKNKPRTTTERDRLAESRALKLMRLGVATPEDERRWARAAGLTVAELRRRAGV